LTKTSPARAIPTTPTKSSRRAKRRRKIKIAKVENGRKRRRKRKRRNDVTRPIRILTTTILTMKTGDGRNLDAVQEVNRNLDDDREVTGAILTKMKKRKRKGR
jgi:hypothetical protein